jgi:predicted DNA-binding ribbon-helix-helix protein
VNEDIGPDTIELGDDAIEVERCERAGVVVSVRLSAEEADRLQDIAEGRKTTLSRLAREVIAAYLADGRDSANNGSAAGPSRLSTSA